VETAGFLPNDRVIEANRQPYNLGLLNYYAGIVIDENPHSAPALLHFVHVPREGWDRDAAIKLVREQVAQFAGSETVFNELLESKSLD
jgi:hypothetical protein